MAGPGSFTQLLTTLEQADFFIGVLPFLLAYLVYYAVLEQVPVIGEKDNFPALIAIIFGFFTSFFLVQNPAYQAFFVNYLGTLTTGIIGILGLFVLLGLTGMPEEYFTKNALAVLSVIVVAVAFTVSGGLSAITLGASEGSLAAAMSVLQTLFDTGIIWGIVILAVLGFTMKSETEREQPPWWNPFAYGPDPERGE